MQLDFCNMAPLYFCFLCCVLGTASAQLPSEECGETLLERLGKFVGTSNSHQLETLTTVLPTPSMNGISLSPKDLEAFPAKLLKSLRCPRGSSDKGSNASPESTWNDSGASAASSREDSNGSQNNSLGLSSLPRLSSLKPDSLSQLPSLKLDSLPQLSSLKLDSLPQLSSLKLDSLPQLSSLNLDSLPQLSSLNLDSLPQLSSLNLDSLPQLSSLNLDSLPQLSSLNLDSLPQLSSLRLDSLPQLSSLNLDSLPKLPFLNLDSLSQLPSLKLDSFPEISLLNLHPTPPVSADVDSAPQPLRQDSPLDRPEKLGSIPFLSEKLGSIPFLSEKLDSIPFLSETFDSIPQLYEKLSSGPNIYEKLDSLPLVSEKLQFLQQLAPLGLDSAPLSEMLAMLSEFSNESSAVPTSTSNFRSSVSSAIESAGDGTVANLLKFQKGVQRNIAALGDVGNQIFKTGSLSSDELSNKASSESVPFLTGAAAGEPTRQLLDVSDALKAALSITDIVPRISLPDLTQLLSRPLPSNLRQLPDTLVKGVRQILLPQGAAQGTNPLAMLNLGRVTRDVSQVADINNLIRTIEDQLPIFQNPHLGREVPDRRHSTGYIGRRDEHDRRDNNEHHHNDHHHNDHHHNDHHDNDHHDNDHHDNDHHDNDHHDNDHHDNDHHDNDHHDNDHHDNDHHEANHEHDGTTNLLESMDESEDSDDVFNLEEALTYFGLLAPSLFETSNE